MLDRVSEIPFCSNLQAAALQPTSLHLSSKQSANTAASRQVTPCMFKQARCFCSDYLQSAFLLLAVSGPDIEFANTMQRK